MNNKSFFYARVFSDTNLYKVTLPDELEFKYGAEVIIKTEFGLNIAVITSWRTTLEIEKTKYYQSGELIRYATEQDKHKRSLLDKKSASMRAAVAPLVNNLKLNMHLTHLLIPLSEDSICIYYTATQRVDFRGLLIELKKMFKSRIVLRHINQKERKSSFLFSSDFVLYNHHNKQRI